MPKRFVAIWFPYLETDWFALRRPELKNKAFVLASPDHGRLLVTETNPLALSKGIYNGMAVADARALLPSLEVIDNKPGLPLKLLRGIAEWCIRYTPVVAIDGTDGLLLDATGCAQLWGGEKEYVTDIVTRLKNLRYHTRVAMAGTPGAAWALAHYSRDTSLVQTGEQTTALLPLPPEALRLEPETVERLQKLGLRQISQFISMPRSSLRRRFGAGILKKLDLALGIEEELLVPVHPLTPFQERLVCIEPMLTRTAIEIALQKLLATLCKRLSHDQKGIRRMEFKCFRTDGRIETIGISTNRPSANEIHLFKLFTLRIDTIDPGTGIEVFLLHAIRVEANLPVPSILWNKNGAFNDPQFSELLDRLSIRLGADHIHRYLPDEHYWPERSVKKASTILEKKTSSWKIDRPRPIRMLIKPEPIEVTVPIPDYPPLLFRHKGKLHKITRADGPERIEQEWWLQQGKHRDYYTVEDEEGHRYWLFRLGHYNVNKNNQWYLHGFFA